MRITRPLLWNITPRRDPIERRQKVFERAHGLAREPSALALNAGVHFVKAALDSYSLSGTSDKTLIAAKLYFDFLAPGLRPSLRHLFDRQGVGQHGFECLFQRHIAGQYRLGGCVVKAVEHDRGPVEVNRTIRIENAAHARDNSIVNFGVRIFLLIVVADYSADSIRHAQLAEAALQPTAQITIGQLGTRCIAMARERIGHGARRGAGKALDT